MESSRYTRTAIWLHWLIGLALISQICFGFLLDEIAPRGTPPRAGVINLHKSIGILIGTAILIRLAWRLKHPPPPFPPSVPVWQRRAADWGHRALYVCMLVMPLSGYIGSNFSKYGVKFFGIDLPPWGVESKAIYAVFNTTHVVTAWILTLLIIGHVAIALKHALIDRDGLLARMWPAGSARHPRDVQPDRITP